MLTQSTAESADRCGECEWAFKREVRNLALVINLDEPGNTHSLGKFHFTAGLQFNGFGFDQTKKYVVNCMDKNYWIQTSQIGERQYNDIS